VQRWYLTGALVLLLAAVAAVAVWVRLGDEADGERLAVNPADRLQQELLRQNLGRPGDPHLAAMYERINADHFGGALPAIPVLWSPDLERVGELAGRQYTLEGMFGFEDGQSAILLTPDLQGDPRALERVLCHEMVHAYLHAAGRSATGHGPEFTTVLRRLSIEGAFEGLVATEEEQARLRAWLDHEAERLDTEGRALDALDLRMQGERADLQRATAELSLSTSQDTIALVTSLRDAHNARVVEANLRLEQLARDRQAFRSEVDRYNLMVVYPDGLDTESVGGTSSSGSRR